jgi:hypothetical protein
MAPTTKPTAQAAPAAQGRPESPGRPARRPDPAGDEWHAKAGGRWAQALALAPGDPFADYEAPPLPSWQAPEHVKREVLGRYLEDRDTGQVHDVEHATPACAIDAIANGTFYHFESELPDTVADHGCMEAD